MRLKTSVATPLLPIFFAQWSGKSFHLNPNVVIVNYTVGRVCSLSRNTVIVCNLPVVT
jgi:hypothetical protein